MKKITKVFLGFSLLASFLASAQFSESFESGIPATWTVINSGDANTWIAATPGTGTAHTGTNVAKLVYTTATAHDDYLITPQFTVTTGVSDHLGLWAKERSTTFPEPFDILLSTTGNAAADFTTVIANVMPTTTWTELSYSLSAYAGQSVYIAFRSVTNDQWEVYLDDIVVDAAAAAAPVCSTVINPADAAVNVPVGTVVFSWTPVAGATSYDLYYGLTPGSATILVGNFTTTTANITLTGYSTTFYWKIVPKNSAGPAVGCAEWSFTTVAAPAAPANDDCANAIAIASLPYTNAQDATSATNNAGFISTCTNGSGMNDGVWYTVVGDGSNIQITVTNVVGWDPELGIYTGSCGAFTCVDSVDDGGTAGDETYMIENSVLGTTYYINIGHYSGTTNSAEGPFSIQVSSISTTPPANDDFANAIAISCGSNYTENTTYATLDQDDAPDGFGADMDAPNVWYSYAGTGTPQSVTLNLCGSGYDTSVLVYTGAPGALTLVAGNDDDATCGAFPASIRSRVTFESDGLSTYYIAIEGYDPTSVGSFTMDVTCTDVTPPAVNNQTCLTALEVPVDNSDIGSDNSYGTVNAVQPTCDTFGSIQDVWFSFVATSATVDVTLSLGSMTSGNYAIYSGICGSLTSLACNSNLTVTDTESLTTLDAGATYYVQVWSNSAEQGTFTLRLNDPNLAVSNFDSSNFRAYPNPVKGILSLSYDKTISNVSVFNLLGQEVINKNGNNDLSHIDMSQLAAGTYMVKVTADNEVKTIKVIKE